MSTDEGRYSRVSRRIWNDAAFRELSQPKPSGGWLFFRLLTGPELTAIPGLFQAWEAGLAQALGWQLKDFRKAWREIEKQGLAKADWKVGLVWLPKAIFHNEPQNPNNVASAKWKADWAQLPECNLKTEAARALMTWAESKGPGWVAAVRIVTGDFLPNAPPNVPPNVPPQPSPAQEQEQDQEQEQEQEQDPPNPQPPPTERFAMHPSWQPRPELWASFDVGGVPRWMAEHFVAKHRSHFSSKKADLRTDDDWNQSCSKWVFGDFSNPSKWPKKPAKAEPEANDSASALADIDRRLGYA